MSWIVEPWRTGIFVRGVAGAVLAGGLCGVVGTYVVLRRMSYIGHGLSHAVFGGAVVGYIAGNSFYVAGGIWGVMSALLINAVARTRKVGADAAIGIVTTASFAVGVALISRGGRFTRNFEAALFGNILGVTSTDLWVLGGVAFGVSVALFFLYKQLLFLTFDPEVAGAYGVRTGVVDGVFSVVLAAAILASMRVLGVTLIAAAIVTPAVVARLSTSSFARMLGVAAVVGVVAGVAGMYVSWYADVASGATITLTAAALFAGVYLRSLLQGRSGRRLAALTDLTELSDVRDLTDLGVR